MTTKQTILIVDDEPQAQDVLAGLLAKDIILHMQPADKRTTILTDLYLE